MRLFFIVAAFAALAGCAGSQSQLRLLEQDGALRVDAPRSPGGEYVVSIRNVKDFGYDPDDLSTRNATALRAMKTQCPSGRVTGETVIDTGEYALGNSARTYAIRVMCV